MGKLSGTWSDPQFVRGREWVDEGQLFVEKDVSFDWKSSSFLCDRQISSDRQIAHAVSSSAIISACFSTILVAFYCLWPSRAVGDLFIREARKHGIFIKNLGIPVEFYAVPVVGMVNHQNVKGCQRS